MHRRTAVVKAFSSYLPLSCSSRPSCPKNLESSDFKNTGNFRQDREHEQDEYENGFSKHSLRICLYPVHPPHPVQRIRNLPTLKIRGILDRIERMNRMNARRSSLRVALPVFAFILFIPSILSKESGIFLPLKYGEF